MTARPTCSPGLARLGFSLILAGTLLNSLFVALRDEYVPDAGNIDGWVTGTFLPPPADIHADLIEFGWSLPPFRTPDFSSWPYLYQKYAAQSHYHSFDLSQGRAVDVSSPFTLRDPEYRKPLDPLHPRPDEAASGLHAPPLYLLIGLLTKRLLLFWGPIPTVQFHYGLALLALALVCNRLPRDPGMKLLAFAALGLSYPFLLILTRGNQGALLAGFLLVAFVVLAARGERPVLAACLLAVACNVRPNAVLLAPLLFCCGGRRFAVSLLVFAAAALVGFALSCLADRFLYPGYRLAYWAQGLNAYYENYVLGRAGNAGNNSLLGAFKVLWLFFTHTRSVQNPGFFALLNRAIGLGFALATLGAWILFARNRLSKREFAFLAVAAYTLASSVFAGYHLFVFAAFPLLLCRDEVREKTAPSDRLILLTSVFLLMPKSYYFLHAISFETLLNPLALLAVYAFVFVRRSWATVPRPAPASLPNAAKAA